ncbi:MAG: hypothetical protein PHI93_00880 [Kiritimatiellae bacterium]|nr:hypothetical protein [Kiritimatiellia bacterium]
MKWCIVAAMTVALLFGNVAGAQDDEFDLDALLGDFDSPPAQVDDASVEAEAVAEAAPLGEIESGDEEIPEDIAEMAPSTEDAEVDRDPFAMDDMAVDTTDDLAEDAEDMADVAPVADLDEPDADTANEAETDMDPLGDLDAFADEEADADFAADTIPEPETDLTATEDDLLGDLMSADAEPPTAEPEADEPAADDDILGDLWGDTTGSLEAEPEAEMEAFDAFTPAIEEEPLEAAADSELFADELDAESPAPSADLEEEQLSPQELKKIARETAKQEEIRRQAAETDALRASEKGFQALSAGNYVAAETNFSSALTALPDRPQNVDVREQISWGLAEAQYLRARGMVQSRQRLAEARVLVDKALEGVPDHRGAQALNRRLTRLETVSAMPKPASRQTVTIERQAEIDQAYDEARQWYMIKDYDRALALFEQVLLRDPYHKSAMRYIRKIEADKYKMASYEREARVQGMMTDVRRSWNPPIRADIEVPENIGKDGGVDSKPASERLNEKMQNIIIPAVEFRQANINDVVNFLVEASIAADPEGEGVNIILNLGQSGGGAAPAPAPAMEPVADDWGFGGDDFGAPASTGMSSAPGVRDITLNLRRISMLDAIKYITEVAGLKYRIEDSAVMITPLDAPVGNIVTRMYPVQPSFMDVIVERQAVSSEERDQEFVSMSGRVSVTKSDVKEFFEKTGVKFPVGASITYNATISQLIVANTADNLETFERILQQLNVVPNQVEIEARFVEVDQSDLEELGLQWILNDNYEFATKKDGSGERMQINANRQGLTQGNRFFGYDSGNQAISAVSSITQAGGQTMLGGILSASSVLTNPEVTIVLQALSQHGGTDLLSAPRVTTRSGVNAQIQVVTEIIYPTEFTVTQPSVDSDGNVTMGPISEPGTFETRETGVILNVTPTVGPDGYTIDLVMAPEVCELIEWLQYGSVIEIPGEFGNQIWTYNMPMPVFTSRNVTTSIVIWDGQTVVMGGLIREELTTIKDKVPLLGDIPVLGRLFRSEGQFSSKKNLLIFVTARLVDPAGRPIHREGTMAMPGAGLDTDTAAIPAL